MNIRLDLEYDGESFCGWQKQPGLRTIQGEIERILERVEGRPVPLIGAGRTDSGVHAWQQVANFHTARTVPGERWTDILNPQLPDTIRVRRSFQVADSFHSRRDALGKLYEYRILNRRAASALDRRVAYYRRPLDWERIRAALPLFVGTKDFKAFQGAKSSVLTTVREIRRFELIEAGDGLYRLEVEGSGFLKQMVRNMVGTLIEIGEGRRRAEDLEAVFASRDRRRAGKTAPARGLFLKRVDYPPHLEPETAGSGGGP